MLLLGVGAGLSFPSLMTLAMSGATPEDSGLASGLVNTTLQVGGALGLAVLATLSATRTDDLLADGDPRPTALTDGYHLAFGVGLGFVVAAIVVAATGSSRRLAQDLDQQDPGVHDRSRDRQRPSEGDQPVRAVRTIRSCSVR